MDIQQLLSQATDAAKVSRVTLYRHRRKDETLEEYLMREKKREERICMLTGWVCIRITWADLADPERTAARIRRILDSRRRPVA